MTKFITATDTFWSNFAVLLKYDFNKLASEAGLLNILVRPK